MVKEFKDKNEWALILGGSSGLGLATAKKLANHGMNICIIHRNSRSQLENIENEFKKITNEEVNFISYNTDAFQKEKRVKIIEDLSEKLGNGLIKILVHSVSKGNLKPMISETTQTLQTDDFQLTIQAMGVSLYDWTKGIFKAKLFQKMLELLALLAKETQKHGKTMQLFQPQK
jgi:enoyl-[acyl-carrier protein] reductase I